MIDSRLAVVDLSVTHDDTTLHWYSINCSVSNVNERGMLWIVHHCPSCCCDFVLTILWKFLINVVVVDCAACRHLRRMLILANLPEICSARALVSRDVNGTRFSRVPKKFPVPGKEISGSGEFREIAKSIPSLLVYLKTAAANPDARDYALDRRGGVHTWWLLVKLQESSGGKDQTVLTLKQ